MAEPRITAEIGFDVLKNAGGGGSFIRGEKTVTARFAPCPHPLSVTPARY